MSGIDSLFQKFRLGNLEISNRIVMAPMTRCFSPGGVPGANVAEYYSRRAAAGVGLIITEGTWVPHPAASNDDLAPRFYGDDALAGWAAVVAAVHGEGGKIMPQLWHTGLVEKPQIENLYTGSPEDLSIKTSPSGLVAYDRKVAEPVRESAIADLIESYALAAESAERLGFDGVEIHGAHGYLIDQFFWATLNRRDDRWGGDSAGRARLGVEIVKAIRSRVSARFPIVFRFSQWKQQDYWARLATSPDDLSAYLEPLADAGVDIFHASQRRFWEPEFENSPLNLAGWAKRLTGKPSITVGSVGLAREMLDTMFSDEVATIEPGHVALLTGMIDRGEIDLVAVGRGLIADVDWVTKVRENRIADVTPYSAAALAQLI
ncbi:MAG: NADH:flavin oxidoreductase [Sphingomonadales bacterium]|jgi:2,4-dienoyl-CoA reductase-like NADH-dependent reductase (Old Yellow Enzyme family)|nr:NADH:flavin oxidoreductase [Sphingomonadales bacterium]